MTIVKTISIAGIVSFGVLALTACGARVEVDKDVRYKITGTVSDACRQAIAKTDGDANEFTNGGTTAQSVSIVCSDIWQTLDDGTIIHFHNGEME